MASEVMDRPTAAALDDLTASLDALAGAGVDPVDVRDAVTLVREMEVIARRVRSVQLTVAERIDRRGLHRHDGHASIKVFVRHNARLSDAEAGRRAAALRCLRSLPAVREAFASGRVGSCHLDRIARAHANPRVRTALAELDTDLAVLAARLPYLEFDRKLSNWVRLTDEDGTRDANDRNHHHRNATLLQDPDLSWKLAARCGALTGARMRSILDAAIAAETALDWYKARAEHGDDTTAEHLPRTDAQRRFDALEHLFDLATTGLHAETGTTIDTSLVLDQRTFEREAARLAGATPTARDLDPEPTDHATATHATGTGPQDGGTDADAGPDLDLLVPGYRCHTATGHPLEPTEAVAAALLGHVRRVVGADGVVIDLGRRTRLFTGPARLSATLGHHHCYWPGCQVPLTRCQTDHLRPWATGGTTDPGNGAPACGRHNRLKEAGYTVHRSDDGRLHTHRPDGTEIT